jgi:hypothetical protein
MLSLYIDYFSFDGYKIILSITPNQQSHGKRLLTVNRSLLVYIYSFLLYVWLKFESGYIKIYLTVGILFQILILLNNDANCSSKPFYRCHIFSMFGRQ